MISQQQTLFLKTGEMRLVPRGEFSMGSDAPDSNENVRPLHTVFVEEFHMDTYMVTNAQFMSFCNETGYKTFAEKIGMGDTFIDGNWQWVEGATWCSPYGPSSSIEDSLDHPVVLVTPIDALAFCKWRSKKEKIFFRLPTEAEWEKAARGTDGRSYPWGEAPPDEGPIPKANFNNGEVKGLMPVDSFSEWASPYQIQGMAGNAWEWCLDAYDETYYRRAPKKDRGGPFSNRKSSVFRGGSYIFPKETLLVTDRHRNIIIRPSVGIGFRTVSPLKKWDSKLIRVYNRKLVHFFQFSKMKLKRRLRPEAEMKAIFG